MNATLLEGWSFLTPAELADASRDVGEAHALRGIRVCHATGQSRLYIEFLSHLIDAWLFRGRPRDVRDVADMVDEAVELLRDDHTVVVAKQQQCWLALLEGRTSDWKAARPTPSRPASRRRRPPSARHTPGTWLAHACYSHALVEAGKHERARQRPHATGGVGLTGIPRSTPLLAEAARGRRAGGMATRRGRGDR